MLTTYTAAQIRQTEAIALSRLPEAALMARAARAVADAVTAHMASPVPSRSAVVLVGPGNNGGDALCAGAILRRRGMRVTAIVTDPGRVHPSAMTEFRRRGGALVRFDAPRASAVLERADAIVDGLVGIGARPPLRAPMDRLAEQASASAAWRIAIDVPSGIDVDTGASTGPVFQADITVTMGGLKTGLMLSDAAGDVRLATIGLDPAQWPPEPGRVVGCDANVVTDEDARRLLPEPSARDDKYSLGVTGVLAGSARYPGAAILAVGGAVRLRPGLVRYVGGQAPAVLRRWPEAVACDDPGAAGRVQAWVAGPGMGTDGAALALLAQVLDADVPVLVDADGLTLLTGAPSLLARRSRRGAVTVITPHGGEFARLFPDLDQADRLGATRAAAVRSGAVVLLKGHRTVTADPAGRTFINTAGSPWLATAGSGDVLAGMAGSLLATGLDAATAVALAAHLHGRAGERAAQRRSAGASALLDVLR